MAPKVYVILINWNGENDTITCLESLRQVEYDDPTEASEAVLLADLLLRMLDRRAQSMKVAGQGKN